MEDQTEVDTLCRLGRAVIQIESEAVVALVKRIDKHFVAACRYMLTCSGRIVVMGMGKSGHIGGKIAATLASTGSPAFFVHPGEASHGDLGMVTAGDVVLALSNSGETSEILTILPIIKRLGVPLIAMTGRGDSALAKMASVHIDVSVAQEACPLGLAPTSSTTAALVMGDALAVSLLQARGFSEDDFARSHPGGRLGRRLLLKVADLMHSGLDMPVVSEDVFVGDALIEMTAKKLGMTAVVTESQCVAGIFTDGDLRRMLESQYDFHSIRVSDVMTRQCATVLPDDLAVDAVRVMEARKISALLVVDAAGDLVGALNMHDLLQAGVV